MQTTPMNPLFLASTPALNRRGMLRRLWVGATLPGVASATAAQAAAHAAAPALLLAREAPADIDPAGYLVSEKLDGVRAFWDGQRLRFRGGGTVAAPAAFLRQLPAGQPLDGELWLGRGGFEAVLATVRRQQPDAVQWQALRYAVFELPDSPGTFAQRAQHLAQWLPSLNQPTLEVVPQREVASAAALQHWLAEVVAGGGEGLVLHQAQAPYRSGRDGSLLKLKPIQDADAVVIGHQPGQGRYAGQLGALRVRDEDGRVFDIGSGLSDAQRKQPPPLGSVVSYRWRGRTAKGLPRFASLWRLREPGV